MAFAAIAPKQRVLALVGAANNAVAEVAPLLNAQVSSGGVVTISQLTNLASQTTESYDAVAVAASAGATATASAAELLRVLKPGGWLVVQTAAAGASPHQALVFAGFTDVLAAAGGSGEWNARRPPWAAGATAAIIKKKKPADAVAAPAPAASAPAPAKAAGDAKAKWTLAATDMTDDGLGDLVDDDALLAKEQEKVVVKKVEADCGTGKGGVRKACKNCSCGLAAELVAEEKAKKAAAAGGGAAGAAAAASSAPTKVVSSCGNCSLGDAFRCAGCPYLGQPAFAQNTPNNSVKLAL